MTPSTSPMGHHSRFAATPGERIGPHERDEARRADRGARIGYRLFAAGIAAYLLLSAQGLLAIGIPYDAMWGPFIAKLHPGTWLVTIAYLVLLAHYGHPMRVASQQFAAQPALAIYLVCILFTFAYSIGRHGPSGAAFIVDTLLVPVLCAFAIMMLDARRRYACLVMMVSLLVLNTLVGLAETLAHARLIPLRLAGQPEIIEDYFRPSALLGHPLANALVTATLLPVVLYLRTSMAWRGMLMLLLWIGILAFGGRTSFVLATLLYGSWFLAQTAVAVVRGRFAYVQLVGGIFVAMVAVGAVAAVVVGGGIGERIFNSLKWDNSASVRTRIWDVFHFMSTQDVLVGVSPSSIADLILRLDLVGPGESIENFWLGMALQLGLLGFVPFAIAMGCAVWWLWKSSHGPMRLSVLQFFLAASSNNSLASKTIALAMLFVAVALVRRTHVPDSNFAAARPSRAAAFAYSSQRAIP